MANFSGGENRCDVAGVATRMTAKNAVSEHSIGTEKFAGLKIVLSGARPAAADLRRRSTSGDHFLEQRVDKLVGDKRR